MHSAHTVEDVNVMMDDLKLKAPVQSARARPAERIRAGIIMTHTQSIINLGRIIRKHESGHVIKVLLVVLLSSRCSRCTLGFTSPLSVIYRKSTHLRGGTTPRILSLCPITVNNEELLEGRK